MAKNNIVSCRFNDDDFRDISNVASQLKLKKSDIIKLAIKDSLKNYHPIKLSNKDRQKLEKNRTDSLKLLGTISTNISDLSNYWSHVSGSLNQIAKRVNSRDYVLTPSLDSYLVALLDTYPRKKLIMQNSTLIRRLTDIWQLLE